MVGIRPLFTVILGAVIGQGCSFGYLSKFRELFILRYSFVLHNCSYYSSVCCRDLVSHCAHSTHWCVKFWIVLGLRTGNSHTIRKFEIGNPNIPFIHNIVYSSHTKYTLYAFSSDFNITSGMLPMMIRLKGRVIDAEIHHIFFLRFWT